MIIVTYYPKGDWAMKRFLSVLLVLLLLIPTGRSLANGDAQQTMSGNAFVERWKASGAQIYSYYGTPDMTPLSDYLELLESRDIYLRLEDLTVTNSPERDWVYVKVSSTLNLIYIVQKDGSGYSIRLEAPRSWRPRADAHRLLIMQLLSVTEEEAERLLSVLQYNVLDGMFSLETETGKLTYYTINTDEITALTVFRNSQEKTE